ncbi:MAG TPA: UPF0175 family protein [Phycisphaerae bacterium]|nr:UPF0175 family protein [Phycisphaerae bacterium]
MTVSFDVPNPVETLLSENGQDPNAAAKEATLVELYRQGKLTHFQLSQSLGLSRFETDGVLKRHNVTEDLLTSEEYQADLESVRAALNA